jgi:hypothetical protein
VSCQDYSSLGIGAAKPSKRLRLLVLLRTTKVWHMRGISGQASNRAKLLRFAGAGQAPANSALGGLNLAGRTQACALKPHDCGDAQRMALARSPCTLPCNCHRASHWIDRSPVSVGRGIIIQDEITTARKWRSGDKVNKVDHLAPSL